MSAGFDAPKELPPRNQNGPENSILFRLHGRFVHRTALDRSINGALAN